MAYAKLQIIGNVGRDPELRYTPGGKAVAQFSVAVSHSKPDGSGGWVDEGTDWFNVSVWGERGERLAESLKKGSKVLVDGRFKTREYDRKDGGHGTSLDLSADTVVDLSASKREGSSAPQRGAPVNDDDIDELPF